MKWFFYNLLFTVVYLLMLPRFIVRMLKRGGYGDSFFERFAVYSDDVIKSLAAKKRIWIHAVSVGEIYAALRLIDEFRAANPDASFILTTTTSTGHAIAKEHIDERDVLLYFPVDFPFVIKKVMKRLQPVALVLTECELWPNLLLRCSKEHVPVILFNGRISDSSYRGYCKLKYFATDVLATMVLMLVQSDTEKERLINLGADGNKIKVMGSVKYDITETSIDSVKNTESVLVEAGISSDDIIITGGSTWPGEEIALMNIFKKYKATVDNIKLVLVPRHMERRSEVESEIKKIGLDYVLRTSMDKDDYKKPVNTDILLVDSTGELKNFYSLSMITFVGKSLTAHGGQNIIEAALPGKPVVVGPNMENFPAVIEDFLAADAVIQVANTEELDEMIHTLLLDEDMRKDYGERAKLLVESKKGAMARSASSIQQVITADSSNL